ncbi:hypothetical protein PLICRDRAFT_37799 [Plicaturopsis crispa FD-325 SS-3]|nr:hypothetical protein PLICRDRAFT_37799 [Plicaturopsis crispa FD-325 SS-3]
MNWNASVLSSFTSDTDPTIVITFGSGKYIFNAGEATGRAFLQSRRNWKKTKGVFLTAIGPERAGGLPGLCMSLADSGITRLHIAGPHGLAHALASARLFVFRDSLVVEAKEVPLLGDMSSATPDALFRDENISVYAFPISPNGVHSADLSSSPPSELAEADPASLKRKRLASEAVSPRKKHMPSSPTRQSAVDPASQDSSESYRNDFLALIRRSNMDPSQLSEQQAQDWRKTIINSMFTGEKSSPTEAHKVAQGGLRSTKKKEGTTQDAPAPGPRVGSYAGFRRHLPKFTYPGSDGLPTHASKTTAAYIVVGPRVRGKFDVKKAESLGVPRGPIRGQLARGETVTFMVDDGQGGKTERTVQADDCVAPTEAPGVIVILDTPSPAHIQSLTSTFADSPLLARLRSDRKEDTDEYAVRAVFHICGAAVLEDERYKAFMRGFGPGVHHLVASRKHSADRMTFTSAALTQLRLNQLDAELFPVSKFSTAPRTDVADVSGLPENTSVMRAGMSVDIRPAKAPVMDADFTEKDLFHPATQSPVHSLLSDTTRRRFREAQTLVDEFRGRNKKERSPGDDVAIVPLGTASSVPTKYRNVSGNLLMIPGYGNILLDCGEGSWGTISRHFGSDDVSSSSAWQVLRDLKCIFISHIHADHHLGLARILAMRRQLDPLPQEPLYVVSNWPILLYISEYSDVEDLGLSDSGNGVRLVSSEALHWRKPMHCSDIRGSQRAAEEMCATLGLSSFSTVEMEHRVRCFGAIIKHKSGWSIAFSGDTMPTHNLVAAGQNVTLLIHEATMADDQVEMAKAKAHSTFGQALDIGKRMHAENILLTHFSARYPKMPPGIAQSMADAEDRREPVLALAFDHAHLTIGDLWKMNIYMPAIEQSYDDTVTQEGEEEEEVAQVANDLGPRNISI